MLPPLGFRFDVDAVVVAGVAHRRDCPHMAAKLPHDARLFAAGEVLRSQRCPDVCPRCHPSFETMLSYQLPAVPLPVG